jgi:hypothetical protein
MTAYDFVMKVVFGSPSGDLSKQESSAAGRLQPISRGKRWQHGPCHKKLLPNNGLLIPTDARPAAGV